MILLIGVCAVAVPTMADVARESWATDQGAYGPLVMAIGLWLLGREWTAARAVLAPGAALPIGILFAVLLPVYVLARITGIIEIEVVAMYALLLTAGAAVWGVAALRRVWFPLLFLLFAFPPPDTLYTLVTQPLKITISEWAVSLLYALGYPTAGSGVAIQIGQYEMLVAAACAGLNSLISLVALGLLYTYLRHRTNWRYMAVLIIFIVPIAIGANLVRVLLLLLITFHFGEAAGQGFLHELAGVTMFLTALVSIFLLDSLAAIMRRRAGDERHWTKVPS